MRLNNFLEGINIIRRYYIDPDGYHIFAEHDTFYMDSTNHPIPKEDIEKLIVLGWFQENVSSGETYKSEYYDQGESWKCFV